jgi:hypothetical protein
VKLRDGNVLFDLRRLRMLAFFDRGCGSRAPQRQLDPERRALCRSVTLSKDTAALELDQVPGNREAEAKSAARAADAGVSLPKAIEDMRKKFRRNADPCISDTWP